MSGADRWYQHVAASPNDGMRPDELHRILDNYLNLGIIGRQMNAVAVVNPYDTIAELRKKLSAEKVALRDAEEQVSRLKLLLKLLLKRAEQALSDVRMTGDAVLSTSGEACGRSDCAAVRTEVAALRLERGDLRRELIQQTLRRR